ANVHPVGSLYTCCPIVAPGLTWRELIAFVEIGVFHSTGRQARRYRVSQPVSQCRRASVSFQAYLDAVESKTGLTPRQILDLAAAKGLNAPGVKAGQILDWLKS